jgi:hypothetical protein
VWPFAGAAPGAGMPLDVCRLLSPATLESVQGSRPIATVPSSHEDATLRSSSCFYSLTPSSQSVNLQVMSAAGTTDIHQFWKQRFHPDGETEDPERDVGQKTGSGSEANERHAPPKSCLESAKKHSGSIPAGTAPFTRCSATTWCGSAWAARRTNRASGSAQPSWRFPLSASCRAVELVFSEPAESGRPKP